MDWFEFSWGGEYTGTKIQKTKTKPRLNEKGTFCTFPSAESYVCFPIVNKALVLYNLDNFYSQYKFSSKAMDICLAQ